jgi:hypothetical protein
VRFFESLTAYADDTLTCAKLDRHSRKLHQPRIFRP